MSRFSSAASAGPPTAPAAEKAPRAQAIYKLGFVLACAFALASTCEAKTHKKQQHDWNSSVAVAPDAPDTIATKANPVCEQLTANAKGHVEKAQAIILDLARSATAPPSTVYGEIKSLLGHPYEDSDRKQKKQKLESERKTVDELNAMLVAAHCKPVDIEKDASRRAKAVSPSAGEQSKSAKTKNNS